MPSDTASNIVCKDGSASGGAAGASGTGGTSGSGGNAGAAGSTNTGGQAGTPSTGGSAGQQNNQAGASGTGNGTGGTSGMGGSSGGAGSSGTGGTSGSGGSSGSSGTGGTAGTAGTGGSSGASGTSGSGGNAGAAGSTNAGGAAGAGSNDGTDGGVVNDLVTLTVHVLSPMSGNHAFQLYAQEVPFRIGGANWSYPQADMSATDAPGVTFSVAIQRGSQLKFNGEWDPSASSPWAHGLCKLDSLSTTQASKVAPMWAMVDGQPAARVIAKKHDSDDGCDLWVTADVSSLVASDDADGDGFSPTATNPLLKDCDDHDNAKYPGQVESWNDQLDLDCDGNVDPATVRVRLSNVGQGVSPVVNDGAGSYAMSWNSNGFYETGLIPRSSAPTKFYLSWPQNSTNCSYAWQGTCYDSSFYNGICHGDSVTVQVVDVNSGTLVPLNLQPEGSPAYTCRRVASL